MGRTPHRTGVEAISPDDPVAPLADAPLPPGSVDGLQRRADAGDASEARRGADPGPANR